MWWGLVLFHTQARLTGIHGYDFDMRSHPVTFRYDESTVK